MEMLEKYKKCIKQYGVLYTCGGDHRKANKAYKEAIYCLTILMKTDFGRAGIYALLEDDDEIIKRYTASLVIHDYPEKCEEIILRSIRMNIGNVVSAKYFLKDWHDGNITKLY